jgi:hypothetical protein
VGDSTSLVIDYAKDELIQRAVQVSGLASVAVGVQHGDDPEEAEWLGVWDRAADGSIKWTKAE